MSNAQPGWYDAGSPGRVRWWDGTQWTAHEASVPAPGSAASLHVGVQPVATPPAVTLPAATTPGSAAAPAGWYPTREGELRWWDGRIWTGSRVRDGRPGIDWAAIDQPGLAWAMGTIFFALAAMQAVSGIVFGGVSIMPVLWVALSGLWFAMAIQTTRVRRLPAPTGAPDAPAIVRPLPGTAEGPHAGWYPVSRQASRWWTGTRWADYVLSRFGVRPTFHATQALKTLRTLATAVAVLAVLVLVGGIVTLVVAGGDATQTAIGWVMVGGALLFAALSAAVLAMARAQTRLLLLPQDPPAGTAVGDGAQRPA